MAKKKTKGVTFLSLLFAALVLVAAIMCGVSFCFDLFKVTTGIQQNSTLAIYKIGDLDFENQQALFFLISWIIGLAGLVIALLGETGKLLKKNINYIIIIGSILALIGGILEIVAGFNYISFLKTSINNPIYVPSFYVEIGVWISSIASAAGGIIGLLSCTKICR